jgi:uncharacterized membrane protein
VLRIFTAIVAGVVLAAYPIAVWLGLTHGGTRVAGGVVLVGLAVSIPFRLRGQRGQHLRAVLGLPLAVGALVIASMWLDDHRFLLAMPVLVNATLLGSFALSLGGGRMPMVERFARMMDPDLDAAKSAHCRQATVAWCAFFAMNAVISLGMALFAPVSAWAVYTGGIAYGLIGLMFGAEYTVRRVRFG